MPDQPPWTTGLLGNLQLVATTGPGGFAKQNGTPTILTWTAPSDGKLHRAILFLAEQVTGAETGGEIDFVIGGHNSVLITPHATLTYWVPAANGGSPISVPPGVTISVVQFSALTAGAAVVFGEIWAS